MRFTLLLIAFLSTSAIVQAQDVASSADAAALEEAGQYEQALAAYQRLAAADPGDHRARLGVARAQERLGHLERAETVYRSLVLEDADAVTAIVGLGRTLVRLGRADEALTILQRAEALAGQDPAVLSTIAEAEGDAGYHARSLSYYERAAAVATTGDSRWALERARVAHGHGIEMRAIGEDFSGATGHSRSGDVRLDFRVNDALRLSGRGEAQRKFGVTDGRGGAAVEWRATEYTTISSQALAGPGNVVLPVADVAAGFDYRYRALHWGAGARFFDFESANVWTIAPVAEWSAGQASVLLRYVVAFTSSPLFENTTDGHSVHLRGRYRLARRFTLVGGYAHGVEDFDTFSIDRVGNFRAETGLAGLDMHLPTLTTLRTAYEYQSRRGGADMQRVTLTIAQGF